MNGLPTPPRWTAPGWDAIPGLQHGFFGRSGGVSARPFASLNLAPRSGDDAAAVAENRRRVARALGVERLALPRQVHGAAIEIVDSDSGDPGEADALLVRDAGIAAGVLTADCVSLLLVAPEARMAAAVHAGWKGTALGIAGRAVETLCATAGIKASSVHAALGPAIGGCCYEVGEEVVAAIGDGLGSGALRLARRAGDKAWVDLRDINVGVLEAAGVPRARIHRVGPCTRCAPQACFSHRGASGGPTGRQVSAVAWL